MNNQNFHALRIIILLSLALYLEERWPFVAILLAVTGVMITFTKISNRIKQERQWKK